MPKTITIDAVTMTRVQLLKDQAGTLQVYAEYQLTSGGAIVQLVHQDITARLSAVSKTTALAALDGIAKEIAALELA